MKQVPITPLRQFMRALNAEQKRQSAAECETTLLYLHQLAANPRPNPTLRLAFLIVERSRVWGQRVMHAAIKAKVITPEQRFNFHGLRHYFTTYYKAKYGQLPNLHADPRVTAAVYDHTVEEHRRAL